VDADHIVDWRSRPALVRSHDQSRFVVQPCLGRSTGKRVSLELNAKGELDQAKMSTWSFDCVCARRHSDDNGTMQLDDRKRETVSSLSGRDRKQSLEAGAPPALRRKTDCGFQIVKGIRLAERSADLVAEFPEFVMSADPFVIRQRAIDPS
jgi:hypothetical protein